MLQPDFILLYVADPMASAAFYSGLFGIKPVESAPTFVMFVFPTGLKLGLWVRREILPAAHAEAGAAELCISRATDTAVRELFDDWKTRGMPVLLEPTKLDFGLSFVVQDPDGHRIRVFAPGE